MQVAVESPQSGVAPVELRHTGIVEVVSHLVSLPHLHTPLTQVLEIDKSHKDVPQTHWHIPRGSMTSDLASNPVVHVTIAHGSKLRTQNHAIIQIQEKL